MWTIIFFTSWQCISFVMGNDDWPRHLSNEIQLKCEKSPPKSSKNQKPIFILRLTSDDRLGWSIDSNPIHHPSTAHKMKCSFFDYVQLLMMGQNPIHHPSPANKMKCSFFDYVQLLMMGRAG